MPRLEYDVVFNLDQSSTRTLRDGLNDISSGGVKSAKDDVDDLNASLMRASEGAEEFANEVGGTSTKLTRFKNNTDETAASLRRFGQASEVVQRGNRGVSKTANNANQILFSFGDAVQDGAQFQHGFASGARAIGNNLTFASEQISIAVAKAGSFSGAMSSLGSALLGPAGIVLAINAAVTVLTVFGDELFSTGKKAKQTKEEIEGVTSTIYDLTSELKSADLFGEDPFGVSELRFEERELNRLIEQTEQAQRNMSLTASEQRELNRLLGDYSRSADELTLQEQNRLNLLQAQQREAESFNKLIEQLKKDEADVSTELQRQIAIRRRFNELTGQDQISIGRTRRVDQTDIVGSFEKRRAEERQKLFEQLGTSEVQLERSIASKKVQIHKDAENAKTKITEAQSEARKNRALTAIEGVGRGITQLFSKQKEVAIAGALVQAGAAIVRQFKDLPLYAAIPSAALVAAQTAKQIQQIRSVEPGSGGNVSSSGGSGSSSMSEGFKTADIDRPTSRQQPNSEIANDANRRNQTLIVEANNVLPDTEFSVRAEKGRKKRERKSRAIRRD